jgi:hypothetical protein
MLLVLLLLASTKAAVPAMASVAQLFEKAEPALVVDAASMVGKTKKEWRKPIMAGKRGFKAGKAFGEYQDKQKESEQRQYPGGGTTAYVDAVVVTPAAGTSLPTRRLPVVTADITATADVRVVCAQGMVGVPMKSSRITLLGRGGTSILGVLPTASGTTLLDCSSGGAADTAVLGLGRGGQLSTRFPTFSYTVREDLTVAVVLSPLAPPQIGRRPVTIPLYPLGIRPNLYYVLISGIKMFGLQPNPMRLGMMQMSLSTTEPFTYLESGAYGQFKMALISKMQEDPMVRITPSLRFPADELCYVRKDLTARLPPFTMTIFFAGGNAGMVLTSDNLWYEPEPGLPTVCMAILPATLHRDGVPILGTMLQRGRTMTIDLTSAQGTLTF